MPTTYVWTAVTSKNWNDPTAWTPGGVPGVGDTARFSGLGSANCTVTADTGMLAAYDHLSMYPFAVTVTINPGVTLSTDYMMGEVAIANNGAIVVGNSNNGKLITIPASGSVSVHCNSTSFNFRGGSAGTPLASLTVTGDTGVGGFYLYYNTYVNALDVSGITGSFLFSGNPIYIFRIPAGATLTMPSTPTWLTVRDMKSASGGTINAPGGTDGTGNTGWNFVAPITNQDFIILTNVGLRRDCCAGGAGKDKAEIISYDTATVKASGSDLVTTAGSTTVTSASVNFVTSGVVQYDCLSITSGSDIKKWVIDTVATNTLTLLEPLTTAGTGISFQVLDGTYQVV